MPENTLAEEKHNGAVIGAGDFIGGEIAKKFASEGFTVFAGRRNGDKLEPLVKEIEAAGGEIHARSLDARKEEEIVSFLGRRRQACAAGGLHLQHRRQRQLPDPRYHRAGVPQGLGDGLLLRLPRRTRSGAADAAARQGQHLLHRRDRVACAAAPAMRPLPAPNSACAPWHRRWRASSGPKNIHVAHLIIDSGVDTEWVRQRRIEALGPNALDDPDLADAAVVGRGILLAALSAAEERLDVRAGNPPVRREVVAGASAMELAFPAKMPRSATRCAPSSRRIIRRKCALPIRRPT